jgi:aryl-alcohol dehydrogenase-like predicted oxidoreductase
MPLDSYVTLGRSGLRVSPFTLGTMTFGEAWGWGTSVAESEAMLDDYLERGGNFIDTANGYTNGHAETIVGDFFARQPERRDRVVIGSKFFGNLYAGDPNGGGAGRKAIVRQLDQSLRRLRIDVDVYWLHNWDRAAPIEETLLEGTVEGELIPMAEGLGMPWGPLKSGFLSGKFSRRNSSPVDSARSALVGTPSARDYDVIDVLEQVAEAAGVSPAAIAWVHSRPGVSSTLIGARRLDQLHSSLLELTLTAEQLAALDAISAPALNFPADNNRDLAPLLQFAGATVDGQPHGPSPFLASSDARY